MVVAIPVESAMAITVVPPVAERLMLAAGEGVEVIEILKELLVAEPEVAVTTTGSIAKLVGLRRVAIARPLLVVVRDPPPGRTIIPPLVLNRTGVPSSMAALFESFTKAVMVLVLTPSAGRLEGLAVKVILSAVEDSVSVSEGSVSPLPFLPPAKIATKPIAPRVIKLFLR